MGQNQGNPGSCGSSDRKDKQGKDCCEDQDILTPGQNELENIDEQELEETEQDEVVGAGAGQTSPTVKRNQTTGSSGSQPSGRDEND